MHSCTEEASSCPGQGLLDEPLPGFRVLLQTVNKTFNKTFLDLSKGQREPGMKGRAGHCPGPPVYAHAAQHRGQQTPWYWGAKWGSHPLLMNPQKPYECWSSGGCGTSLQHMTLFHPSVRNSEDSEVG